jgi:hypothetical protein
MQEYNPDAQVRKRVVLKCHEFALGPHRSLRKPLACALACRARIGDVSFSDLRSLETGGCSAG